MKQLAIEAGKTRELETWRWFSAPTNISNFKTFQLNNIMRIEAGLKGKNYLNGNICQDKKRTI